MRPNVMLSLKPSVLYLQNKLQMIRKLKRRKLNSSLLKMMKPNVLNEKRKNESELKQNILNVKKKND